MNPIRLALIFTGHGERDALPILIRRVAEVVDPGLSVEIVHRRRSPESKRQAGELEPAVERAARQLGGRGGILILMDSDWDEACPAKDGPMILNKARSVRPDLPLSVVLAHKEYEAWFIAAAESLRGKRGISEQIESAPDPEAIRNAKGWLSDHMPPNRPYAPVTDQPALTALFDFDQARRGSGSFDKCYREVVALLTTLRNQR
jgi:hypothetical protein